MLLGISPGLPNLDTHLSSLYVQAGGKHLLFDCGEGTSHQLLRHNLDGDKLDAVFISHYHPDHISGIFMLLQMLYLQKRTKPLQLFLPERPAALIEMLQLQYTFIQKFGFPVQILDCNEIELYHEEVSPAQTDHLLGYADVIKASNLPNQMSSYAFRIEDGNGALVYSSDLETTDCIAPILADCHTAIIDALHPTAAQVMKLQYTDIRRVILTHGISLELAESLMAMPVDKFETAREDNPYFIE
jgi:ribonuclease BN (tRNA processing enzyme)